MSRVVLRDLVDAHSVLVCVGSGGVGKTTTAAALALWAAMQGRRTMVLTIDPAKRLAQSLGLEALSNEPQRLDRGLFERAGIEVHGDMDAAMLDQKSAWDEFILRNAPNGKSAEIILENEFYQHLSRSFAGSTEYMAVEELCRIHEAGAYDLIVLDTPPTAHALDFLEAPRRLRRFLDRKAVRSLVLPYLKVGWSAWKGASRSARFLLSKLEDATGVQALRQISEFFVAMEAVFDGIAERSLRVENLLSGERTAFLLVAGPEEQVLDESEDLSARMAELGMPLKGVIMNRVHNELPDEQLVGEEPCAAPLETQLATLGLESAIRDWLLGVYGDARKTAYAESIRREAFELALDPAVALTAVPEMDHDVHDLGGLAEVIAALSLNPTQE